MRLEPRRRYGEGDSIFELRGRDTQATGEVRTVGGYSGEGVFIECAVVGGGRDGDKHDLYISQSAMEDLFRQFKAMMISARNKPMSESNASQPS